MKLVFWGGPLDGEVRDLPGLGPIHAQLPVVDEWRTESCSPGFAITDMKVITYYPRELYATNAAKPAGQDTWWVMVPADADAFEMQRLIDRHSTPVVDGGHRR